MIEELEILRLLAALMLVIDHIPFNLFNWHSSLGDFVGAWWAGSSGIDLFLVVSGFVVARSLLPRLAVCEGTLSCLGETLVFFGRRAWRLLPAAWVWLVIPLVLCVAFNTSGAFHDFRANLAGSVAAVLMVHDLWFAHVYANADAGIQFPYWALSLNEQASLALPVLALVLRRRLAWAMLALLAWQFVMPHEAIFFSTRPGDFALGVLLAIWSERPGYDLAQPAFLRGGAWPRLLFVVVMVLLLGGVQSELPRPLVSIPFGLSAVLSAVLVYVASLDLGCIMGRGVVRRAFVWAGARAYAITLVHLPAFALTRELYAQFRPPIYLVTTQTAAHYLVVGLGLTAVFAELTYQFVELPGRRIGQALRLPAVAA